MRITASLVCVMLMISAAAAGEDPDRAEPEGLFYPLKIWIEKLGLNFIFDHTNWTKALKSPGRVSVIQQSIIEAGGRGIAVSAVNGNVSVHTEGGNATITRDGGNVTVVSVTNNSRQVVIIRSMQNNSYSSRVPVRSEASSGD